MEREQKRIKLIKAVIIISCIIVGTILGLSLAACASANDNAKNKATNAEVSNYVYTDNNIYVYSLYDESESNRFSYREYIYHNAVLTQYENYFIIEYKINNDVYIVTYSNSAFGYAYGGKKK